MNVELSAWLQCKNNVGADGGESGGWREWSKRLLAIINELEAGKTNINIQD